MRLILLHCVFSLSGVLLATQILGQKPVITSFSPASGSIGSAVQINGSNFSSLASNDIVYFGAVRATVINASANSLTVNVPAGAMYQPISVTVNGLTAWSRTPFIVTFPGASPSFFVGSFLPKIDSIASTHVNNLGISDIDGDGKPDIAVINTGLNIVSILQNNSTNGSISLPSKINFGTGKAPSAITITDLDGDGRQDLIITNSGDSSVSVLRNTSVSDSISFAPKTDYRTGKFPAGVASGDFDNDGKPDLAIVNEADSSVSVLRNISTVGNISFAAKTDFRTGSSPTSIILNDLNGDGKQDFAVTNYDDNSFSVFRNISNVGSISFNPRVNFPTTPRPIAMAVADLDKDDRPDLIIARADQSVIIVLKNLSTGSADSFGMQKNYPIGSPAFGISVADIDGDGKPDIATANTVVSTASVLKNQSLVDTISLGTKFDYPLGDSPFGLSVADMDGDGKPEIVSANYALGTVSVLRNTVNRPYIASFSPATAGNGALMTITGFNLTGATAVSLGNTPVTSFFVESAASITAVIDTGLSGDVKVTTPFGTATRAGFTFSPVPTISSFSPSSGGTGTIVTITGTNFLGTTAVDFGGFPATSFTVQSATVIMATVGSITTGSIPVSVTNPSGTVSFAGFYTGPTLNSFTPSSGPVGTTVIISGTHFNTNPSANYVYFGAVRADVLTATDTTLTVAVSAGATYEPITVTTGSLTAYSSRPFVVTFKASPSAFTDTSFVVRLDSAAGSFPLHASISDINNDGKPDVVLTNTMPSTISVFKNTSNNGIVSFASKVDYATSTIPTFSVTGDLDGDGKPDIVVLTQQNNITSTLSFSVFQNITSADTILFAPRVDYPINILMGDLSGAIIRDFDEDGKPDLTLISNYYIFVFRNTSTGGIITFSSQPEYVLPSLLVSAIYTRDVDGDGKTDIIAATRYVDNVQILRNTSAGGQILFAPKVTINTGFGPGSVFLGDLNNDGKPDMAVTAEGNNSVWVYKNSSARNSISFDPAIPYPLGNAPHNVAITDLNGDGKLDLAVSTHNASSISVFRNTSINGNISFADHVEYHDGFNQRNVFIANMNGDGKPDLVTPNPNGNSFSILLNELSDDGRPTVIINASGPTEYCEGGNVLLKASAATGSSFQWYNDGTPIPSATDSFFIATMSGTYSVDVTNGSNIATSALIVVTVKPLPATPTVSLAGSTPFCQGASVILLSSAPGGNQWYRNDTLLPGIIGTDYRVRMSGVYKVKTTGNGCSSLFSNVTTITTNPLPAAAITASATEFCKGDSLTLNSNAGSGMSIQWNVNENQIVGAVASNYVTKIPGNFSVTLTSNGCSTVSPGVAIARKPLPSKPVVSQAGTDLLSSATTGNQWYRNGVIIAGATSQAYTPLNSANYTVTTTINGCASPMSDNYNYTVTAVITIDNSHFIKLSPNPVRDRMIITFNLAGTNAVNITLVDLAGRVVNEWKGIKSGDELNLSRLPGAMYIARIQSEKIKATYALKLIKE